MSYHVIVTCENCSREFSRPRSAILKQTFCSQECYKAYGRIEIECGYCGKKFTAWRSQVESGKSKYCSKECYSRTLGDPPIERICKNCNKAFMVRAYKIKNGEGHFCCRQCQWDYMRGPNSPSWRGGWKNYYGSGWSKAKKAARKRASYQCEQCGKAQEDCERALDVHHKIPVRNFKNPDDAHFPDNLIVLCIDCHREIELEGYKELPLFSLVNKHETTLSPSDRCINCNVPLNGVAYYNLCRSCALSFYHLRQGHNSIFPLELANIIIDSSPHLEHSPQLQFDF